MAKRSKRQRAQKTATRPHEKPAPPALPSPITTPADAEPGDDGEYQKPTGPALPKAVRWLAMGALTIALGVAGVWLRERTVREEPVSPTALPTHTGIVEADLAQPTKCAGCHALKDHSAVVGHAALQKIDCTSCHGGVQPALSKVAAHGSRDGAVFFGKTSARAACLRCHVPGFDNASADAAFSFVKGGCVGCHQPGARNGIGPDLRLLAGRDEKLVKTFLLDPQSIRPEARMWSLRDPSLHGYFADTPQGNSRVDGLVTHVLAVADDKARLAHQADWAGPKIRIDGDCTSCHRGSQQAQGATHRCAWLKQDASLRCATCHQGSEVQGPSERCPRVAAASHLCAVCHLRPSDGHRERIEHALARETDRPL